MGASSPSKRPLWKVYLELSRLHKFPLGTSLIFWPCAWGLSMAAYATDTPPVDLVQPMIMYFIGSTIVHSAACVINDICDVDFDRQIERTKNRPLPAGTISMLDAWMFLLCLTVPVVVMLSLLNPLAALLGAFGIFPLHAVYPLMKRWTYLPQVWLGLTMNWGFSVAWASLTTVNTSAAVVFYLGSVCWGIVYDTVYAVQDRTEDVKAGVKSAAILFGDYVRPILCIFAATFVLCMTIAGVLNDQGMAYFVISCGGAAAHFIWQMSTWKINDDDDCSDKFRSNGNSFGWIVLAGMLADLYLKTSTSAHATYV